jgi:hypothetical protein
LESEVIEAFLESELHTHIGLLCKYQVLSEELIQRNKDFFLDERGKFISELFLYNDFSEDFLTKNIELIDLPIIGIAQDLSEEFLQKYCDKIGWNHISKFQRLSEDFIKKHEDKISWIGIMNNKHISNEFLNDNFDKITNEMRNSLLSGESTREQIKSRVYNFNLPDDLREHLKEKSELNRSSISQEIINLILDDKKSSQPTTVSESSEKPKKFRILKRTKGCGKVEYIPQWLYSVNPPLYQNVCRELPKQRLFEFTTEEKAIEKIKEFIQYTKNSMIISEDMIDVDEKITV